METPPVIVWLSNNLRLDDNPALSAAAAKGAVVPVFIHDDSVSPHGSASKWWLQESLRSLSQDFARLNINLILRKGKSLEVLRALVHESGAKTIMASRRYEPALAWDDSASAAALAKEDISVHFHKGFLLFDPADIRSTSGTPFKVYTPFSKACFAAVPPALPIPTPTLHGIAGLRSDSIEDLKLVPQTAKWPHDFAASWSVGEKAAHKRLHHMIDKNLPSYKTLRDRPDHDVTSRLSPDLHFGNISPRRVWHMMMQQSVGADKFLQEVLWREFSWHLLVHVPDFTSAPLQKSFVHFPWREAPEELSAWQKGLTGYPLVDAGMRQLWKTGWMHNRVRMIVASFLVKDLLIDWQQGMAWFWDTLLDADLGNNTASWQWVAGCGADAAPYFRIFNPTLQGQKFDPEGRYVRHYVPELAKLPSAYIHQPWTAPHDVLAQAGVVLGSSYPLPLIDHGKARERALSALKISKGEGESSMKPTDLFD